MRLGTQLKPWMLTALIVAVLVLSGGGYLLRLALRDEPTAAFVPGPSPSTEPPPPTAAEPTDTRTTPAPDPIATHTPLGATATTLPAPVTSPSSVRTSRATPHTTSPTSSHRGPTSAPTKTPRVVIAGPTVDNIYPNDDGCHIFWIRATGVEATIARVHLAADEMRADYVACDAVAEGYPPAAVGCGADRVVSSERGCGIRMKVPASSPPGLYRGTLSFDLTVLCNDTAGAICSGITSPYPPSPARPVLAAWAMTCLMELQLEQDRPQNANGACELTG